MTTALFLLRCLEIGLSLRDLDLLTIGMVLDIWTERSNDDVKYEQVAGQEQVAVGRETCGGVLCQVQTISTDTGRTHELCMTLVG